MTFFKFLLPGLTILRVFQILKMSEVKLKGNCIEFGASDKLDKNFFFHSKLNKDSKIIFSNIKSYNKSFKIIDLTKKIKFSRYYDRIIIFNVLEHVSDLKIALKNLYRLLKANGELIGSTPFLYRVHGAPRDYSRFTADFLYQEFKSVGFKNIRIQYLGYGPFLASFSILHGVFKFLPFIYQFLLLLSVIIDFILIKISGNIKKIYPLGFFFILKK
jgi:SAM-dependent methyltransferase